MFSYQRGRSSDWKIFLCMPEFSSERAWLNIGLSGRTHEYSHKLEKEGCELLIISSRAEPKQEREQCVITQQWCLRYRKRRSMNTSPCLISRVCLFTTLINFFFAEGWVMGLSQTYYRRAEKQPAYKVGYRGSIPIRDSECLMEGIMEWVGGEGRGELQFSTISAVV